MVFFPRGTHASEALWSALEEGGKVVLMRHAPVKVGADAGSPLVRDPSCRRERNLSLQGKRQAREIGRKFAQHRVPVSQVLHSPFCRTTETAQLAFGEADPAGYLSLLEVLEPELVVLGTGSRLRFPPPALTAGLLAKGIGVEVMDTAAACRTYNVLMSEGRQVVAALLLA